MAIVPDATLIGAVISFLRKVRIAGEGR